MSRHANFAVALGIALLVALLLGLLFMMPECAYEPTRQSCLTATRQGALTYGVTALGLLSLSVGLHLKGSRFPTFLAVLGLMILPFVTATVVSR